MARWARRTLRERVGLLQRGRLVCQVLLAQTNDRLVLVDTGFGMNDITNPMQSDACG